MRSANVDLILHGVKIISMYLIIKTVIIEYSYLVNLSNVIVNTNTCAIPFIIFIKYYFIKSNTIFILMVLTFLFSRKIETR